MKLFKFLLPLLIAVGFASPAFAQNRAHEREAQDFSRFDEELNERDFDALRDFLYTKRTIDVKEKADNLAISGDVRTEWRHLNERRKGHVLRGGNHVDSNGIPLSRNDFDIEFNLRFDYVCDRAWAVAHIRYDNGAGVDDNGKLCCDDPEGYHGSGFCDDLCLKKAYMGYNICCDGDTRFDVELGRRNLYHVFDSKIQFLSRFDGLLLKYSSSNECFADWYVNVAGFVVDERVNHFAWITEIGFINICDSGFDFKYSFIDWEKHGKNRCFAQNPKGFRFLNSQWTVYYHLDPEILCVPAKVYGAFLWNAAGHKHTVGHKHTDGDEHADGDEHGHEHKRRANLGWYVGFTVGEVVQEGDWAIDVQYQVVEARAMPDDDMSGIGRGNVRDESFTVDGRGNTNFQGYRIEALYALTDNLTLDTQFEWSTAYQKSIGGSHRYSKFEIEAIYAF